MSACSSLRGRWRVGASASLSCDVVLQTGFQAPPLSVQSLNGIEARYTVVAPRPYWLDSLRSTRHPPRYAVAAKQSSPGGRLRRPVVVVPSLSVLSPRRGDSCTGFCRSLRCARPVGHGGKQGFMPPMSGQTLCVPRQERRGDGWTESMSPKTEQWKCEICGFALPPTPWRTSPVADNGPSRVAGHPTGRPSENCGLRAKIATGRKHLIFLGKEDGRDAEI
jgi:hypothetical protein